MGTKKTTWYAVEVCYETIGGDIRWTRTLETGALDAAAREQVRYAETGHKTRLVPIEPPASGPTPGRSRKVGSHG